jgi:hypothetical protein
MPATSAQVQSPLALNLAAGTYALVFGGGLFGSTGSGGAPENDTDIGTPSYFFLSSGPTQWLNNGFSDARMFLI